MTTVYLLQCHGPYDEYDQGSSSTWVESVYDNEEEAIKARDSQNFILRKQKVNEAERNYYTVAPRELLKRFKK